MKRVIILLALFMLMVSSAFSVNFQTDQISNLADYRETSKGNTIVYNVAGSVNQLIEVADENLTLTTIGSYDFELELPQVNKDFYFIVQNDKVNQSASFIWRGDLTRDDTLYIQNVTMNEIGRYIFKFEPSFVDEPIVIYFGLEDDLSATTVEYMEEKPEGFNDLVGGLVRGFNEIVDTNVTMWKVLFYVAMFVLVVGFVFILFGISFFIFQKARQTRKGSLMGEGD